MFFHFRKTFRLFESVPLLRSVGETVFRPVIMAGEATDIGLPSALHIMPVGQTFVEKEGRNLLSLSLTSLILRLASASKGFLGFAPKLFQEGHLMECKIRDSQDSQ